MAILTVATWPSVGVLTLFFACCWGFRPGDGSPVFHGHELGYTLHFETSMTTKFKWKSSKRNWRPRFQSKGFNPNDLNGDFYSPRVFPASFQCPVSSRDMTKLYEDVYISELRGALQRITNDFTIDEAGLV